MYNGTMPRGKHLRNIPREERVRRLGQEPLGPGEGNEPVQARAPRLRGFFWRLGQIGRRPSPPSPTLRSG